MTGVANTLAVSDAVTTATELRTAGEGWYEYMAELVLDERLRTPWREPRDIIALPDIDGMMTEIWADDGTGPVPPRVDGHRCQHCDRLTELHDWSRASEPCREPGDEACQHYAHTRARWALHAAWMDQQAERKRRRERRAELKVTEGLTTLCRWCREPLTPHKDRGRPAETHKGTCRTRWQSQRKRELRRGERQAEPHLKDIGYHPALGEISASATLPDIGSDGGYGVVLCDPYEQKDHEVEKAQAGDEKALERITYALANLHGELMPRHKYGAGVVDFRPASGEWTDRDEEAAERNYADKAEEAEDPWRAGRFDVGAAEGGPELAWTETDEPVDVRRNYWVDTANHKRKFAVLTRLTKPRDCGLSDDEKTAAHWARAGCTPLSPTHAHQPRHHTLEGGSPWKLQ